MRDHVPRRAQDARLGHPLLEGVAVTWATRPDSRYPTARLLRFQGGLRGVPRMEGVSPSASRMYFQRGQSDEQGERHDYFNGGAAGYAKKKSLVVISLPSDLKHDRRARARRFSCFCLHAVFASSLDTNRNPLLPSTNSAGILYRIRASALSSSFFHEMGLGASVFDLVCLIHPNTSTNSWQNRAFFRLGLSPRTWLFRPARSHTAFLHRSIIFRGSIPEGRDPKAQATA